MKRATAKIISILLVLSCIACAFGSVTTLQNVMDGKEKWEENGRIARENVDKLYDGVMQLSENEKAFLDGLDTYTENLEVYKAGQKDLEAGAEKLETSQAMYDEGADKLAAAHEEYEAGVEALAEAEKQLAAGKATVRTGQRAVDEGRAAFEEGQATLEAGKAELAANTDAYNKGKQKLALVTPLYNAAVLAQNSYDSAAADYQAAVESGDEKAISRAERAMNLAEKALTTSLAGYSLAGIKAEYEEGLTMIAAYEEAEGIIAEGERQLAEAQKVLHAGEKALNEGYHQLEDGQKQIDEGKAQLESAKVLLAENDQKLADAKKELDQGYKDYEAGKEKLDDGAVQLEEGLAKLQQYIDGGNTLADGLETALSNEPFCDEDGDPLLKGIADRLGTGFDYWMTDSAGEYVTLEGNKVPDLDYALDVVDVSYEYLDEVHAGVTEELSNRAVGAILGLAASLFGLVAAVFLFIGKGKVFSMIAGLIAAVGAVIALVIAKGAHPFSVIEKVAGGSLPFLGAAALALFAIACVVCSVVGKTEKAEV